jgi:hypothetical protein
MLTWNRWDAPIELSGAVYQALHKITSLRHLRVRLDVTPSPKMVIRHGNTPGSHPPPPPAGLPPPSFVQPPAGIPPAGLSGGPSSSYPSQTATKISNIKRKKAGGNGGGNYWANGRAFSGFKSLNRLALMGMSNLDCLPEVAECVKASSATLKCLTLSLSMELARKARKPVPVNPEMDDPSDTELDEDDLLNDPMPPPTTTSQQQPVTNEADIRKEKLAQESILARVFDLQSVATEGKKIDNLVTIPTMPAKIEDSQAMAKKANAMRQALLDNPFTSAGDTSLNAARLDQLKMIRETADMFITQHTVQKKLSKDQPKAPGLPGKGTGSVSKSLYPTASGLKTVGSSSGPSSNLIDWDLSTISSPTSPFSHPEFLPKDFVPSGNSSNGLSGSKSTYSHAELTALFEGQAAVKAHLEKQDKMKQEKKQQQAQTQAYSSPYNASPFSLPSNGLHQNLYDYSQYAAPGVYPPGTEFIMNSVPQGMSNGSAQYPYGTTNSNGDVILINDAKQGLSSTTKKNKHPHIPSIPNLPVPEAVDGPAVAVDATVDVTTPGPESSLTPRNPSPAQQFFAADLASTPAEESMDVDMDHPDEDSTDLGQDQEFVAVTDESEVATPRKRAKFATFIPQIAAGNGSSSSALARIPPAQKVARPEDVMQAWICCAHGLQLEELSLELVPLKGSIVARALDLTVLKRITFLEVGPQDAFWSLLLRLQDNPWDISFKSIHTDNVSHPFVKFLATFEGLEELYMHERSTKQEPDPTDATPVTIRDIRKSALKRHLPTLKRLMIRNEKNEKWDVDHNTVDFLAKEGTGLIELAFSLNMKTYVRYSALNGTRNANLNSIVSCKSLPAFQTSTLST